MMRSAEFLTEDEKDVVLISSPTVQLPTCRWVEGGKGRKKAAWEKTPDGAFVVGGVEEASKIAVVFEVGFSEPHTDLERDARQWLMKGEGLGVRCVVLCVITEDKARRATRRGEMERDGTMAGLARRFGNRKGRLQFGLEVEGSEEESEDDTASNDGSVVSDADLYHLIARAINIDDWVAPNLTATMEFWRLNAAGVPARDGDAIV